MKININSLKEIPNSLGSGLCVFGTPNDEISAWIAYHNLVTEVSGKFTNILIPEGFNVDEAFISGEQYEYVDGFSPNLNKFLHAGHTSNFVIAKALQKMGIGKKFIANLGDTLEGNVSKEDALTYYQKICKDFDYQIDQIFFASELVYTGDLLKDGEGDYADTKVFNIGDTKQVGIKGNGSTSYFYQDVALANQLNAKTLYLTGFEQSNHFEILSSLFPTVKHLPLGLVTVDGKKMSSREGNVIYLHDMIAMFNEKFNYNYKLVYNVMAGYILKSQTGTVKNIDMKQLDNVKTSQGLYLSYTLAKLKSAGMIITKQEEFNTVAMKLKFFKAKNNIQPSILFDALVVLAKEISSMYEKYYIKDNIENQKLYQPLAEDLLLGMTKLGLFDIDKV